MIFQVSVKVWKQNQIELSSSAWEFQFWTSSYCKNLPGLLFHCFIEKKREKKPKQTGRANIIKSQNHHYSKSVVKSQFKVCWISVNWIRMFCLMGGGGYFSIICLCEVLFESYGVWFESVRRMQRSFHWFYYECQPYEICWTISCLR